MSMSIEERIAALEAAQTRRGKWVSAFQEDLLKAGEKYANMKVFRTEFEEDGAVVYEPDDAKDMADYLLQKMGSIAVQLLREMAKEEPK